MNKEKKLQMLQALSEEELTKRFLIPLYESMEMGCKNVRYTHRRLEFGKDVVYYKEDEYGNRVHTGVQVKKIKITTKDVDGLLRQTTEAFGEPFTDLSDGKKKDLDRFVVLTSNEFLGEAGDSFRASLRGAKLEKLVTCIGGNQLVVLLDKYLKSAFWDEYDLFNKYFRAMRRDFTTIKDVSAIGQKEAVSLEQIYVSLRVSEEVEEQELPLEQQWKIFDEKQAKRHKQVTLQPRERAKVTDADRVVADYKRLVIVGDPGSGKTTLLKHLALKWCRENLEKQERMSIPVPIVLRQLADSKKSIREYIDVVFEKYEFPNAKKWIEKDLKQGKCRLLLDGYDELATKESHEKVAEEIEKFIRKYKKVPVLVTSRIVGYHDELRGFTKAELLEFDDNQIGRFAENWFRQKNPERAKSMLAAITSNEQIKMLARNPLMITIIAIIYEEDRKLPERRADLYQRCVEVLLSKWDIQKQLNNKFAADKKKFILRKLAFYGHTNNKRIMTQEEVRTQILKHFPRLALEEKDLTPFLEEIWQRSSLLRQISMDSYDFLHLSFQEYFTALELTEREDATDIILNHLDEPWWEEPILLYAGIRKDASALIRTIWEKVPEDIFHSNLMLCGKFIVDADFTDPSLKEQFCNELYGLYETGKFSILKDRAIRLLGRIKPDKITDTIIVNLAGNDENIRSDAAYALGKIGSKKVIKPLIKALTDESGDVRLNAVYALREIGNEKAIKPLTKALTDKERHVRNSAASALVKISGEKTIKLFLKTLTDESGDVRLNAVYALGEIGSEKAIKPLLKALTEEIGHVRGRAASSLGKIGSEKAIKPLLKALTEENGYVRGRAASALGEIGGEKAIKPLLKALTEENGYVRGRAASALGKIGGEKAIKPLLKALTEENVYVRGRAASALGEIGGEKAIKSLLKALTEENGHVRGRAASALGKIGGEKAIKPLIKALTEENRHVRGRAASALGKIGGEKAIKPLIKALTEENSHVRNMAASALGKIGSEKAIKPLIKALTEENGHVRGSAASALGKTGNEKAIKPLLKALTEENSHVRNMAASALVSVSKRYNKRILLPAN